MKRLIQTVLLILSLAGCSMLPQTKHESAATKAADSIATQQSISVEKIVDLSPGIPLPPGDTVTWSPITNLSGAAPGMTAKTVPEYHARVKVTAGTGQTAGSNTTADAAGSVTLPLGVKLILLAVGIILLVVALWFAKRSNAAVAAAMDSGEKAAAAAIQTADSFLSARIRALRDKAIVSADPKEIALHQTEIANLEADRGKLAASAAKGASA